MLIGRRLPLFCLLIGRCTVCKSERQAAALVTADFQLRTDFTDFQKDVYFQRSDFRLLVQTGGAAGFTGM